MGGMGGARGSIMIVEIDVLSSVMNEDLKYEVHDERWSPSFIICSDTNRNLHVRAKKHVIVRYPTPVRGPQTPV